MREHAAWVEANGSAQLRAYTGFVAARQAPAAASADAAPLPQPDGAVGNGAAASPAEADVHLDAFQGRKPQSMAVLADLDTQAVVDDLEGRVRDVVRTPLQRHSAG